MFHVKHFDMKIENKKSLARLSQEFFLSDLQGGQFQCFVELLESWSSRTNLVSKNDVARLASKHISESLEIERLSLLSGKKRILDLGAGAGFPGVPLAIVNPNRLFVLLDSRRKKTLFLQEVADECSLTNIAIVCDRVENYGASFPDQYDVVVSRAVASLDVLWKWSVPILENAGCLIAIKGGDVQDEVSQLLSMDDVKVDVLSFCKNQSPDFETKKIIVAAKH